MGATIVGDNCEFLDKKKLLTPGINTAAVVRYDAKGNILEANANFGKMLRHDGEGLSKLTWDALTPREYHALDKAKLEEARESGQCAPYSKELIASDGKCIPVIVQASCIDNQEDQFLGVVLDATGFENAGQDFQKLAGRLLNLYDDERRRIARQLHDTTAQNLAALSMNLTMLAEAKHDPERSQAILNECTSLTEECLKEVRSLSYMLHPPLLDELGLESALRAFIPLYERRTGVAAELVLQGQLGRLSPEVELAAFRVAQECLFNVHDHSGSGRAEVQLARTAAGFEVIVRDWGKGMGSGAISGKSVGIAGMRERVRLLGGRLEIGPADPGTVIRAVFPRES